MKKKNKKSQLFCQLFNQNKNSSIGRKCSRKIQGFTLIYEQSCLFICYFIHLRRYNTVLSAEKLTLRTIDAKKHQMHRLKTIYAKNLIEFSVFGA